MPQMNSNPWLVTKPTEVKVTRFNLISPAESIDIFELKEGDLIKDTNGNFYSVSGPLMEDDIDYLIPCNDGNLYSPLFFI